jgi:hypothetical protein
MPRVARLEIPKAVKLEVFRRAGGPEDISCEGCSLRLGGKAFDYDHSLPEWMQNAPRSERVITANDVKLLGRDCCHKPKTAKEAGQRAHGVRIVEKLARINRRESTSFTRHGSTLRKKLNGDIVDKYTGEIIRKGNR